MRKRTDKRSGLVALALLAALLVVPAAGPARAAVARPEEALPALDRLDAFQPGEPAILYSDADEPFAVLAPEFRVFVPLREIPKVLRDAVVATEDARFYSHGAVDIRGMARAVLKNLASGRVKEGGSTITQQLAKTLFLTPERTVARKVKEIQLAAEIERRYSKDKILEMYLNLIYFGHGAYGVEAASRTYFSKSVRELSLPEAAVLAGLPRAPGLYSPLLDKKRARDRRGVVLERMVREGYLTKAQARQASRAPLVTRPFFHARGIAPSFVDFVRQQLEGRYSSQQLLRGGLKVYTTLNLADQRAAVDTLRAGVRGIEASRAGEQKARTEWRPASAESASGGRPAGKTPAPLEGALVAMDPRTGELRAMVGGTDYGRSQFNRAVQARRQPGSAFKPIVYAAAFEGPYSPATVVEDAPISFPVDGRAWTPENFDRRFRGPVTLRRALEESINVATVRLVSELGVDRVIDMAQRLGITSDLRREMGLALGVSEVSLFELVSAYAVFANHGLRPAPFAVRRVLGPSGETLEERAPQAEPVLSEEVAFVLTSVLEGVVERGTGKGARTLGRPVAAKTGTSQDAADLWFVGYTPGLVAGIWIGYDAPRSLGVGESAGRLAAPVWTSFMKRALAESPPEDFPMPDGVIPLLVNARTGQPTTIEDPDAMREYFIRPEVVGSASGPSERALAPELSPPASGIEAVAPPPPPSPPPIVPWAPPPSARPAPRPYAPADIGIR